MKQARDGARGVGYSSHRMKRHPARLGADRIMNKGHFMPSTRNYFSSATTHKMVSSPLCTMKRFYPDRKKSAQLFR